MRILLANFSKMVHDTGGVAKVSCALANEMRRRGHTVEIVYVDEREGKTFFPLDFGITAINLQHYKGTAIHFPLWMKVKRELLRPLNIRRARMVNDDFITKKLLGRVRMVLDAFQPNVIVTFQPAANKIFLLDLHLHIPLISMSHGDPEDYFHTYPPAEVRALPLCTVCQVLLPSFKNPLQSRYPQMRVEVIGNAVPEYEVAADLFAERKPRRVLFIGRLVKNHKRPHLVIEAFAHLAADFPDWILELWGAEDRKNYLQELRDLIAKNHLETRIHIKGTTNDVASVLFEGDLFVMPSAYEGFPLALTEAMSMGLPAIGYRHAPAVNELIQDGKTGLLVGDGVKPLEEAMRALMASKELRARMGKTAREAMKTYAPEVIWDKWDALLKEIARG